MNLNNQFFFFLRDVGTITGTWFLLQYLEVQNDCSDQIVPFNREMVAAGIIVDCDDHPWICSDGCYDCTHCIVFWKLHRDRNRTNCWERRTRQVSQFETSLKSLFISMCPVTYLNLQNLDSNAFLKSICSHTETRFFPVTITAGLCLLHQRLMRKELSLF